MKDTLIINNLSVSASGKGILKGVNLKLKRGEIHILMGPNGVGKTTLAMVVMGDPRYQVTDGQITVDGKDITNFSPDQRAKAGLFISFQKPPAISGVSIKNLLKIVIKDNLEEKIAKNLASLKIKEEFLSQSLNENFSGGETKKMELLQAKIISPRFLILDEIDSGLDVDSLSLISRIIRRMSKKAGILIITHNPRILKFLNPDYVHILMQGRIVKSDGQELGEEIDKKGYQWLTKN